MPSASKPQQAHETDSSPAPILLRVDDRRVDQPASRATALAVATSPNPRLSWIVPLVRTGQAQTAYEIRASRGEDVSAGDLWSSGVVESAENSDIRWGGEPLAAHDRVRFAVRTRDERGELSEWSDAATIQTGPFTRGDWQARWIAFPAAHAASMDFDIPDGAVPVHATLHLAGHGVVRAVIDGTPVNPDARDLTDASLTRSTSRSYDVTELLTAASVHRLSLVASIGHYRKVLDRPRTLAELRIVLADGPEIVVGTDASWTQHATSLVHDEPFYVEEHDARVADEWTVAGVSGEPVDVLEEVAPGARPGPHQAPGFVVPDQGPPVRIVRRQPATMLRVVDGVHVFDLGENVAGRTRVELDATTAGAVITVAHGEKLDATGRVDTTNIRMPDDVERERQLLVWHADGSPMTIEPWFAVGGFRYVEVRGHSGDATPIVTAGVLHSDAARTGWLETDVPQLDAIVDAAIRTQLNNTNGFPSDCPTREQAGWTGDASVSVEAALAHLDLAGMYRNWLTDVALDAQPDGGIRGVAPNLLGYEEEQGADPVWGSALNEILWQLWWTTGETTTITTLLPALRTWVEWQIGTLEDGVSRNADLSFGADWLALEQTPPVLLQTGAVVHSLRQLADLEEATGDSDAATRRRAQAHDVVAAALRVLRDPVEATWGNGSQGSTAVALAEGLAPEEDVAGLRARLRAAVSKRGDRLATGFSATRSAVRALAEADGGTALLDAIRQQEQPGIGSMLTGGPGTFWEAWWIDDENVGVASLDHIGLGAPFAAWAWTHAAGIRPLTPGYRRFSLAPRLLGEVNRADIRRDTPRGRIEATWSYHEDTFTAEITVPVGSTAVVTLPGHPDAELGAGHHHVEVTGIAPVRRMPPLVPAPVRPRRGTRWLSDGATSTWLPADDTVTVQLVAHDSFCAPVHHESVGAPYLQVTVDPFLPDTEAWLALEQDEVLDLTEASFVYAHVDVDNGGFVGRALRPLIRVTSADGDIRIGEARPFPVQWTRVAVDIGDWPGRSAITKVEVGIRWSDVHDSRRGPYLPLPPGPLSYPFKVGRVGWTNAAKTY